ncbi:DUF4139 domain-containing protein [Alterisphingorhabdus coralli]|uniref:DUF4139 domain-containing protein n=1 Tax=Alterisphingorhabdus coralli TaxID=3071408 RepID=A0AA97I158_9SPHN|nr:hypothetical protein [Parasphingorhabdus sp. SCSIO 66989]WOE75722.1 hypothetical protein RB602_03140 [Parasphingorhabdus sp. SCSIO 66989]
MAFSRHCEELQATRQSRAARYALDCFATLAMTMILLFPALAAAQSVVTSDGPDAVEVSIYRDNSRGDYGKLNLKYLQGFALISETRRVTLPAGAATIRFEGVASGIDPASALVTGIGVEEKNQDARLLTQRGLLDHFTGQRVTLRRTDPATGETSEESATIRSGSDRLIVQTVAGFEAVACTGLNQTLVFDRAPEELSAKPTLSVNIGNQPGGEYTLTLTYLAQNFDWQANYVAEFNEDASAIDLLGWMTMASGDATSFIDANTNAIAGTVFRDQNYANTVFAEGRAPVRYQCWPAGTTGAFQGYRYQQRTYALRYRGGAVSPPPPPPPPPAPMAMEMAAADSVMVTAQRRAEQEDLGDLKLYRIPFPTTVAANSQKQVAFLRKQAVPGEIVYMLEIFPRYSGGGLDRIFRMQNKREEGLGEPMPSGQFAFFQQALGLRQLVGEDGMSDKAVGEEIELALGGADNVTHEIETSPKTGKNWQAQTLTIRNANAEPVTIEAEFQNETDFTYRKFKRRTFERDGKTVWRTTVPANDEVELRYRVYGPDDG